MSGYYDDEYYEDEYEGSEEWYEDNSETSYHITVHKAENGQLFLHEGQLTRYPGEDWGEASGWWEQSLSLGQLTPDSRERCIELGRGLKPGESTDFYWNYASDEEDDDDEGVDYGNKVYFGLDDDEDDMG